MTRAVVSWLSLLVHVGCAGAPVHDPPDTAAPPADAAAGDGVDERALLDAFDPDDAVLDLPPVVVLNEYGTVVLLDPESPPAERPVTRLQSPRAMKGKDDSVRLIPARDFEVVEGDANPPLEAMLVTCPRLKVEGVRQLWIRDHLGEGVWRRAIVFRTEVSPFTGMPCGEDGPAFTASGPPALIFGTARDVSSVPLRIVPPESSRPILGVQSGAKWVLQVRYDDLYALIPNRNHVVEVSSPDHRVVPFALCIDGRLGILEDRRLPHGPVHLPRFHAFASCPAAHAGRP